MKVLIILLLVVILIYFIYLKKEKFLGVEVTPEIRAKMTQEQINQLQDSGRNTITYSAYMEFETEHNNQRFNDFLVDYVKKINFITDFKKGLGFKNRENSLPSSFNISFGEKKYRHYLGFKNSQIVNLEGEYVNPYDFATIFIEKFKPNASLIVNFNKGKNMRLRYEIFKDDLILFSNYIYYNNQAVIERENDIKLISSHLTNRYEPYGQILTGQFLEPDTIDNLTFNNYLKKLHMLIIDIKNANTDEDYKKVKDKYKEGFYNFAFEDFDRIEMNNPDKYFGDFMEIVKEDGKLKEVKVPNETEDSRSLIFKEECHQVRCNLFIPPSDKYKLRIICETSEDILPEDILISMEYNFSYLINLEEKVINDQRGEPISLRDFSGVSNDTNNEDKFYLNINTTMYKDEYAKIDYVTKNPNKKDLDNPNLVDFDNINPFRPGRYYKYVNLMIFKTLINININMRADEISDDNTQKRYNELINELELFKEKFLQERQDDRVLKDPSPEYKRLNDEINRLLSLPLTQEIITITGTKQQELNVIKFNELNEKQPLGPFQEKIDNLNNIYTEIMNDYNNNNDKMKIFLKNITGNQSGSFENLIENYLNLRLFRGGENIMDADRTLILMNNLKALIDGYAPDGEGITDSSQKSRNKLNSEFGRRFFKDYNFIIDIKEEPPIYMDQPYTETPVEPPEPTPEVSLYTEIMRKVIRLVKRDFRKIVRMKRYESLDPELEGILRSIKKSSDIRTANTKIYKKMIRLIVNLIEKIRDGSIDDINDLLQLKINSYEYPNEVLTENFSNINIMNPIRENFIGDIDLHKHTSEGRINFGLDWGNPLEKSNQGRYDEYGLLSEESKQSVLQGYNNINNVLTKADGLVTNFVNQMEQKVANIDFDKIENETNKSIKQIETTQDEMDKFYQDTENKQNEKIARITEKVKELEKIQNKKYLGDLDSYNSIKSFGDGQVISVQNMKKDIYNILMNDQCLQYSKKGDISLGECNADKSQQFKLNMINDRESYNNLVVPNGSEPVSEYDNVKYPFNVLNPILHKSQCLTLNGNSMGVKECVNSNKQRWEGLKNIKLCDNFNMN